MHQDTNLARLALPPTLIALARGNLPHPLFEYRCERLNLYEHWRDQGLDLQEYHPNAKRSTSIVPLWEHNVRDGHAFEVVYYDTFQPSYWHVMIADDSSPLTPECVARSEQGLYFWLFYFLIGDVDWQSDERAVYTLREAAKAVGFRNLDELLVFEEEIRSDSRWSELLQQRSTQIT